MEVNKQSKRKKSQEPADKKDENPEIECLLTWIPDELANRILWKMISSVAFVSLSFVSSESNFMFSINVSYSFFYYWMNCHSNTILINLILNVKSYFMSTKRKKPLHANNVTWYFWSL